MRSVTWDAGCRTACLAGDTIAALRESEMVTNQRPLELILARNFLTSLSTPAFLVDDAGAMIFYNEAAGGLLGMSFEEFGHKRPEEWGRVIGPFDGDGKPVPLEEIPTTKALRRGRPAHGNFTVHSVKGEEYEVESTALPIEAEGGQEGAMIFLWVRNEVAPKPGKER